MSLLKYAQAATPAGLLGYATRKITERPVKPPDQLEPAHQKAQAPGLLEYFRRRHLPSRQDTPRMAHLGVRG